MISNHLRGNCAGFARVMQMDEGCIAVAEQVLSDARMSIVKTVSQRAASVTDEGSVWECILVERAEWRDSTDAVTTMDLVETEREAVVWISGDIEPTGPSFVGYYYVIEESGQWLAIARFM